MRTTSRRKARETALKVLYECEVGSTELDDSLSEALESAHLSPELSDYARMLVHGVADHQEAIDDELDGLLTKYDLMRVAAIDRNVLRIAAFEIEHVKTVPPRVSINEAIEIVKRYSTAESGRFINGVLGKYLQKGDRAEFVAGSEEETAPVEVIEVEESVVEPDSPEVKEARKLGVWKLRASEPPDGDVTVATE